jgi:hypothetical protein
MTPGCQTSEYQTTAKVVKWATIAGSIFGTAATALAVINPLAAAVPAVLAGVAGAVAAVATYGYTHDRTQLKIAAEHAQKAAQDAAPIVDAVKRKK